MFSSNEHGSGEKLLFLIFMFMWSYLLLCVVNKGRIDYDVDRW